jgi:hypothetical protein
MSMAKSIILLPVMLLIGAQQPTMYKAYLVADEGPFDAPSETKDLGHGGGHSDCPSKCNLKLLTGPERVEIKEGETFSVNFRIETPGGLGGGSSVVHSGGAISWGDGTYTNFDNAPIPGNKEFTGLASYNQTKPHKYLTAADHYTIRAFMQGDFKISDPTGSCSYRCRAVASLPVVILKSSRK